MQMIKSFSDGDPVIIFEDMSSKKLVFLQKGLKIQNKYGSFSHDNIIGLPPGSKIFAKNKQNFVIALLPTPVLITETLSHKTQILYEMDISMIIMKLNLAPGSRVIESGTGSGSLSSSISTVIQSTGHLFTFEFNKERYENAKMIFQKLKMSNITVLWRDSCGEGFLPKVGEDYKLGLVDAVFLDLPKPWEAVVHSAKVLRKGGKICCFSPCIEQVQKTHDALRNNGFWEMEMIESLCRNFEKKERMIEVEEEKKDALQNIEEEVEEIQKEENEEKNKSEEKNENEEKEEKVESKEKKTDNNKKKKDEKKNLQKRAFYSTGSVLARGHTGYLTFATFYGNS